MIDKLFTKVICPDGTEKRGVNCSGKCCYKVVERKSQIVLENIQKWEPSKSSHRSSRRLHYLHWILTPLNIPLFLPSSQNLSFFLHFWHAILHCRIKNNRPDINEACTSLKIYIKIFKILNLENLSKNLKILKIVQKKFRILKKIFENPSSLSHDFLRQCTKLDFRRWEKSRCWCFTITSQKPCVMWHLVK